jgi:hypothetical protein
MVILFFVQLVAFVRLAICDLNRKMSPSSLTVGLVELTSVNMYVWKLLLFRVASFFIGALFDEPLCVFGVTSFFHQRSF